MATFQPKILINSTRDPKSTIGDDIKKEKVTPKGKPALVKPINNGIDEQEQNGVIVPSNAAKILAPSPWKRPIILLVLSGGKKLCIYEIIKIRQQSKTTIFIKS